MKPFKLDGDVEVYFEELNIDVSKTGLKKIDYAFLFSYQSFLEMLDKRKDFTFKFVNSYWKYFLKNKRKFRPQTPKAVA